MNEIIYCNRILDREGKEHKTFYLSSKEKGLKCFMDLLNVVEEFRIHTFEIKLNEKVNKDDFKYL